MIVIGVGIARPPPAQLKLQICCALSKQGDRFLRSLVVTSPNHDLHRLLRKFVSSSSKNVAITTLSHLLSPTTTATHPRLSSFALPLYLVITEASWFDWNPKLVADLIALLHKQQRFDEAGTLVAETVSKLSPRKRDLCSFYCHLIDSQSKHKLREGVFESYAQLKQLLLSGSSSAYLKRRGYESMIKAMCEVGLPFEAEEMMEEMRGVGLKPSKFEFRCLVYGYGKIGLFGEMKRIVDQVEGEGFPPDTIISNMVLSSFGAHKELAEMCCWLQKMKASGIAISIRTYNSVLNSCPKLNLMLRDMKNMPLSLEELAEDLSGDERSLVLHLVDASSISVMEWKASELKLDLHGMHLCSAYLIMLQWFDELGSKCDYELPNEIRVVCGSGKHSAVRGKSPVKDLVKKMIVQMKCPLRNDDKNIGCFVAKGNVLKEWMMQYHMKPATQ
ncbi:PREDICTED: pentatricopeptide repeat-containing protein At2g17033 isoform X2 [Ipomoea nil]|uniref:pentatricopeptide repeat-containing protein At2g17033 isoform X2 n=2 Tax=Ipomoea nil TaxID=35883 RepID=UPI0009017D36|nr:PREDICTED: pentatricopeptide repeat-containing protein At2g17033 isoform X2 [Ipomoea nil]